MENRQDNTGGTGTVSKAGGGIRFVLLFFLICFVIRTAESLLLRTDRSVIGELFVHKLIGVALLAGALRHLRCDWREIGLRRDLLANGILTGAVLGAIAYFIGYAAEFIAGSASGGNPALRFFVTSYGVSGNIVMQGGLLFILICVAGNILNVVMEEGVFRGLFMKAAHQNGYWKAALLSSLLFGLWHVVEPIRNVIDGEQSPLGALMMSLMLFAAGALFGITLCMLCRITGSLWAGMTLHFINNAGANLIHVVTSSGTDTMQTMRIAVAQAILFVIAAVWLLKKVRKAG